MLVLGIAEADRMEDVVAKIGVFINPAAATTAGEILEQARAADRQGFDSVWLGDHLIDYHGEPFVEEGPLESFTLMTAIGAVTSRIRLAWGMLNPSFRNPAVLAKMLATLDQITEGRVICSLGAGWLKPEYEAYDVPFIEDHGERIAHEREVVQLLKELWTHPAPERVTFEGEYVRVRDLAFNPVPYQRPHPPSGSGAIPRRRLRSRSSSGTAGCRSCGASRTSSASCGPTRRGRTGRCLSSGSPGSSSPRRSTRCCPRPRRPTRSSATRPRCSRLRPSRSSSRAR